MTVVSYLKLNDKSGVGCADERVTYGPRTYDYVEKIYKLTNNSFIASSGSITQAALIMKLVEEQVKDLKEESISEIARIVEKCYDKVRKEKFQAGVLNLYGITLEDLTQGNIDQTLKARLIEKLSDPRGFSVDILLGGYDSADQKFKIYNIQFPGNAYPLPRYATIGSGVDRGEIVIGDYIDSLSPEMRDNIPLALGCRIVLEATQSAWRNIGVGGRSQLVYIENGDGVKTVNSKITTLLHNLLFCENRGIIDRKYVDKAFESLIVQKIDPKTILTELKTKVGSDQLLELLLFDALRL